MKKLIVKIALAACSCGTAFAVEVVDMPSDFSGARVPVSAAAERLAGSAGAISAALASGDGAAADRVLAGLYAGGPAAVREQGLVVLAAVPAAARPQAVPSYSAPRGYDGYASQKSALGDLGGVTASAAPAAGAPAPAGEGKASEAKDAEASGDGEDDLDAYKIGPDASLNIILIGLLLVLILL